MARDTREYDPGQIIFNVGGRDVSGYAAGTFVEVERNKDGFTLVVGSDGENTRVKSQDRSGTFKCTLQQSSPLNDYFSSLATQDELSSNAVVPILLKDANGTTIAQAKQGWVKKKASSSFADAVENREWTFETGNLSYEVGGENTL
jgi:hypothetical protein